MPDRQKIAESMTAEGAHTGYFGPLMRGDVCRTGRGVHVAMHGADLTITPEGICTTVGQDGLYLLRSAIDGLISDATHKALNELTRMGQEDGGYDV